MPRKSEKERPIIFTGPSIPAILEDRKTQTRRVMDPQPEIPRWFEWRCEHGIWYPYDDLGNWLPCYEQWRCPYGVPGDRLWLKETHAPARLYRRGERLVYGEPLLYKADDDLLVLNQRYIGHWRSPRFMPRWASRITLELTDVRPQRVQDISPEDVLAEGIQRQTCDGAGQVWYGIGASVDPNLSRVGPIRAFGCLWDSLNRKRGYLWTTNPWIWALTFRRLTDG